MSKHSLTALAVIAALFVNARPSAAEEESDAKIDFAAQVQPLLIEHCGKCHGEKKKLGKLQLHTAEAIQNFHEDELVVAGKPDESELFQRVTLPADNKKRMPKGADPLSEEQIALLRQWIAEGALFTSAEAPAGEQAADVEMEEGESTGPADDAEELAHVEAAAADAVAAIEATGATVMPLFAGSPLLQVSYAQSENPADDAAIAALVAASEQIVWLNLSGAVAAPAGYAPLAQLKNLSRLHLEKSSANDEVATHVAGLDRLHYLNLYGTQVTDAGLEHLKGLKRLRKLFLWKTQASYDVAMALEEDTPGLEVNLGWDHPEVAKRRLTKQVETAKQQLDEATKTAEEAKKQAEAANKDLEQVQARLKDYEEQLNALTKPAEEAAAEEAPAEEKPAAEEAAAEEKPAEKAEEKAAEEAPADEKADDDKTKA